LKDFALVIADPVCHIFNASISSGLVPDLWKRANVVPIPKSQPPRSIQDDLRPISLTHTLSKLLETTLGRRLLPKNAGNLDPRQFGALRGRSTTHALIAITHQCYQALDDRNSIRAVFIDFSKAFDRIDHSTILTRMAALGIQQSAIRWMHSFLSNRQQRVKIGPVFSEWEFLTGAMPQCTWFGPYAFIIMIGSLRTIDDTYKFVDDVTLTEVITPSADSQMQLAVNQVVAWSQSNFMNINTKKPKEMLFGSVTSHPLTNIAINKGIVEQVSSFKLLGVVITNNPQWEEHVTKICAKANKRPHFLKSLKRADVTTANLLQYYKSVIRPVVEYACPVWQSALTIALRDRLESLQRRAIKMITNSNDCELQCALYGIELIGVRLDNLARLFFNRICNNNDCLHYLIPDQRSIDILCKLRQPNTHPGILCRAERFSRSFLPYALANYQ
jgi:hypothetical protein